jgi:biotin carboxylase
MHTTTRRKTTASHTTGDRLLAVILSPRSRPWTEIVEAGTGLCRFLWLVDAREPAMQHATPILRRFGKVIDIAGCTMEEMVRLAGAERPEGIASFCDADLHLQAWLAAALGLPSPSIRSVARLTDKLLQRDAFSDAGVPIPRYTAVREPVDTAEIERLCAAIGGFPMVLKPRNGTACRNISSVSDVDELVRVLAEEGRPSEMILEEQMADPPSTSEPYAGRISIDSIVSNGVHSHLGITGLFPMVPPFRSSGGFFPADVPSTDIPQLFDMATAAIQALGSDFGCYRTEIKLTPEGRKIIEVNGRPTGLTPAVVKLAAGLPLMQLCLRLALGEQVIVNGPLDCDRVAYRFYSEPPMLAQRLLGFTGLEELSRHPGVVKIDVHKQVGDQVDWRNGSLDKIFQVTGVVADHAELAEHYRACTQDVTVTYDLKH